MHFANGVRKDKEGEAEERRMSPSSLINRIVFIRQEAVPSELQLLSASNPKLNQLGCDAAFRPGGNNQLCPEAGGTKKAPSGLLYGVKNKKRRKMDELSCH